MLRSKSYAAWRCAVIAAVCLLAVPGLGSAQSLSARLCDDAADGHLDEFDFATAALVASGVESDRTLGAWRDLYHSLHRQTFSAAVLHRAERFPEAIHAQLHERVLVGRYQTAA